MSTASLAHEQQEPTPLHPDGNTASAPLCADDEHEWESPVWTEATDHPTFGHLKPVATQVCAKCGIRRIWPQPMPLTATERSAFLGLQARQRELVQIFNEEERAIVAEIEARLGLDVGAIGTSHTVNAQAWQVVAMPQQDGEEAAASQR